MIEELDHALVYPSTYLPARLFFGQSVCPSVLMSVLSCCLFACLVVFWRSAVLQHSVPGQLLFVTAYCFDACTWSAKLTPALCIK